MNSNFTTIVAHELLVNILSQNRELFSKSIFKIISLTQYICTIFFVSPVALGHRN
jgi:hypothetical protein